MSPLFHLQKLVIHTFCDALCLRLPPDDCCQTFDTALKSVWQGEPGKDAWRLAEGFVAAEGADLVDHLEKNR